MTTKRSGHKADLLPAAEAGSEDADARAASTLSLEAL